MVFYRSCCFFSVAVPLQFHNCAEVLLIRKRQSYVGHRDVQQRHAGRVIDGDVILRCSAFAVAKYQVPDLIDI